MYEQEKMRVLGYLHQYREQVRCTKLLRYELEHLPSAASREAISACLNAIEAETGRLEYYCSLLDEKHRQVIEARYLSGLPWREIETALGRPYRTLNEHLEAAVEALAVMYRYISEK